MKWSQGVAAFAVVLLILVAGVALLYAMRARMPPATASSTASPTPTATIAAVTSTPIVTPPGKTNDPVRTVVHCGTLVVNSRTSGQGSGPNTFELLSPTGNHVGGFSWVSGQSAVGTYICARLTPGVPNSGFDSLIRAGEPEYVAQPSVAIDSCGSVTGYAADGAHMLVTLTAGGTATQYRLEYQFVRGTSPTDIGDRLSTNTPQLLLITGRQVPPDSGSPNAISLREYGVARVAACAPTSSVSPRPTGFTLPLGCAYLGQPVVGGDQNSWSFDCGWASRDARGSLASALTEQGWISCGAVTATASWAKGTARLLIAEASGSAGDYPKFTQPARPATSSSCP